MYYGRWNTPTIPDKLVPLHPLSFQKFKQTVLSHYLQHSCQRRNTKLAKGFLVFYEVFWTVLLHGSPKGIPLYNIIEFGNPTESERPFQMDLLNQLLFWSRQVTLYSSKTSISVKREAALGLPYTLYYQYSSVFKSILQRGSVPMKDWETDLLWARQCSFLFTATPLPKCSGFVNLFYVSANMTAREAVSSTSNSSPLESHHGVC